MMPSTKQSKYTILIYRGVGCSPNLGRFFEWAGLTFACVEKHIEAAKALGKVVRKYREKRGLSKQVLAYESGLGLNTIKRIESGESAPGFHVLFTLASTLRVPASTLIKEAESHMKM